MATGSLSDYARHIGASPAYVSKLKRQGRIVMREVDGKQVVDFELSDRLVRNSPVPVLLVTPPLDADEPH